jgi:hypothetical protein
MPHDSAAGEGWQLRFISSGLIDPSAIGPLRLRLAPEPSTAGTGIMMD